MMDVYKKRRLIDILLIASIAFIFTAIMLSISYQFLLGGNGGQKLGAEIGQKNGNNDHLSQSALDWVKKHRGSVKFGFAMDTANNTSVTDLSVWPAGVFDMAPLGEFPNTRRLYLAECPTSDLSPITKMKNLVELELVGCDRIKDLSPLFELTKLQNLVLANCSTISDLSPLSSLRSLRSLDLRGTQVRDLKPLSKLTSLENLVLQKTKVKDLSRLTKLTNLRTLYLYDCPVEKDDVEKLKKMLPDCEILY